MMMSAMKKPYILASLVSLLHKLGFGVLTVFAYLLLTSSPFKGLLQRKTTSAVI